MMSREPATRIASVAVLAAIAVGAPHVAPPALAQGTTAQSGSNPIYDAKWFEDTVAELNRSLPRQVDAETRLDQVSAGPGPRLTYSYTLIHRNGASVDIEQFNAGMQPQLRRAVCGQTNMAGLLRAGVSLAYSYRGSDGKFVSLIEVEPQHCK